MERILITGATGNVGQEVIKYLATLSNSFKLLAAVRRPDEVIENASVSPVVFDFQDLNTYDAALQCEILFLLRPPHISDVNKYFVPVIEKAKKNSVRHIVFLSVQGVEKSKIIPHHKIEKLIVESCIPYTFLRPAYFMQNFTTTLRRDLVEKDLIYLPAGKAKFTIIDVVDIGRTAAKILVNTQQHINKVYELTGSEKLSFQEMAEKLSEQLRRKINYKSPNLFQFYLDKRRGGAPIMLVVVMIMLHYLPSFQKEPALAGFVREITGTEPRTFVEFIESNRSLLEH